MSWILWKKKECVLWDVYFVWKTFLQHLYFISMHSILNKLSEYRYFYIPKSIIPYTILLVFKNLWGLCEHLRNFLLLKFSAIKSLKLFVHCDYFEKFRRYIYAYVEQKSPLIAVWLSPLGVEKPSVKNCDSGKVLSAFVSDTTRMTRLLALFFTSESNLFLIKFMLTWPMIPLYGFLFLRWWIQFMNFKSIFIIYWFMIYFIQQIKRQTTFI